MELEVPESKIARYLLVNRTKSSFFLRRGYSVTEWPRLRDDILDMARRGPLTFERDTAYGRKYSVRGEIEGPDGRRFGLTTIWMLVVDDETRLTFLTAYPT